MFVIEDWTYGIISVLQTQNDYIHEWLPQKEDFLQILLDLEAPPLPHICKICGKDRVYRCSDCMHQPLLCTDCCCLMHATHPLHRVQQWTGDFFKDSALHMTSLQLHLGHDGAPCPSASIDYLTVIDVTGVHFMLSQPCQCMNAESYHKQLLHAKLYPSTFEKPSTAFTFLVFELIIIYST
ncbi:hypothetical protein EDC04DRAFT_2576133 [Pisolithus marmoratus]|nr:hypothetical protein EDC04DRAFT_2576133 [Pisolithus marmoratus]